MRIEARVFQAALKSYGYDPGVLDGVIGQATRAAQVRFDDWVASEPGGDTFGDYSIVPAADNRSVEILPNNPTGQRFQYVGSTYLREHPEEITAPAVRHRSDTSDASLTESAPTTLALPFFRMNNPWLWLLIGLGLLGLGGSAFLIARRMRRRR